MTLTGQLDVRFSEAKQAAAWSQVADALVRAELYWLTTVRKDGRPHTTPLVGAWVDDRFVFCTGPEEQKALNLAHSAAVTVTTGVNTWNDFQNRLSITQSVDVQKPHLNATGWASTPGSGAWGPSRSGRSSPPPHWRGP